MKTTNTSILAAKAEKKKITFSAAITGPALQNMITGTLKDPRRAANFTSTLISIVSSNTKLKDCDPGTIVAAALRGEGMDLSLALGQYNIVPFKDTATYQLSYKGLCQLAMRSNMYEDFDAFDVREGEYKGRDPRTRQPIIEWIDDEDEREKVPLAGIYTFYKLKGGFFKSLYWTHEKILSHANTYAPAFNKELYEKLWNGELDAEKSDKLLSGSPWYGEPLSEQHLAMCKKTLLRKLLNDGKAPLSIEMRMALADESAQEKNEPIIFADDPAVLAANPVSEKRADDNIIDGTANEVSVDESPAREPASRKAKTPSEARKPQTQKDDGGAEKNAGKRTDVAREGDMPLEAFMNPPTGLSETARTPDA